VSFAKRYPAADSRSSSPCSASGTVKRSV